MALVQLACAIVHGATNVLRAEQLQYHWRPVFSRPVSDISLRRTLEAVDAPVAARVERARAVIHRVVWTLLALRPKGFPWISVCGRELTGWYVLDLDATIVTCTSQKEGAASTFKGSFGHMPLGAWLANTRECVAMLPRPATQPPTTSPTTRRSCPPRCGRGRTWTRRASSGTIIETGTDSYRLASTRARAEEPAKAG